MLESDPGVDIRKTLFYALSKNSWPLIGIDAMGATLEDIFISLTDNKENDKKNVKAKKQGGK